MKFLKKVLIVSIIFSAVLTVGLLKLLKADFSFAQNITTDKDGAPLQQITAPEPANAQVWPGLLPIVGNIVNIWGAASELVNGISEVERGHWLRSAFFQSMVVDTTALGTCDAKDTEQVRKSKICIDEANFDVVYDKGKLADGQTYRMKGELGFLLASSMDVMSTEPPIPTDMALFMQDTFEDTIIPGKPAYAQMRGFSASYQKIILGAWRITRNFALALLGTFVGAAALMVMFRAKLDPRASVTVYNILPMIPICLGLILLSYPIMALAIALIDPLTAFAMVVGRSLSTALGATAAAGLGVQYAKAVNATVIVLLADVAIGIAVMLMWWGVLVAILIAVILLLWQLAKVYLSLMYTTIFMPLIVLMAIIPGKSGLIMNLVKRVLADIFALPLFILAAWLGLSIISYTPADEAPFHTAMGISLMIVFMLLKFFMGCGVLFGALGARKKLEKLFGVGDLWGNDPPARK